VYKTKNELASEMLEWALAKGYPPCTVLADSWFGVGPFIKSLKRLNLSYVIEVQSSSKARVACKERKLTPTGRIAKKQYDLKTLPDFFQSIENISACGFDVDEKNKKPAKVLYHTKVSNIRLNSIVGKHRVVESINPATKTTKYLLTNELTWESSKTISTYSYRWVIEEFFRNAKQLLDMEGVNVRSEQGITTALCLVFYIDFLLHLENCENIAESSQKESKTVPSIIRRFQHENQLKFIEKVQLDEEFIRKWISVESDKVDRNRKTHKDLIEIPYQSADRQLRAAS
jgi:SRSO17 transposase